MFYLGLDFGTSGARACVIDAAGQVVFEARAGYVMPQQQDTADWRAALFDLLAQMPPALRAALAAIAVDGTSGTVLLADDGLEPVAPALLYNDMRAGAGADAVPLPGSLAKGVWLMRQAGSAHARYFLHQADWLAALLTGVGGLTDYHNALKTGFDPHALSWPAWIQALPIAQLLPRVVAPGTQLGRINRHTARHFNLNPACRVRAGTTDSIAAFVATGVEQPGYAVTSLGTTLVLKLLSTTPVESAEYGVYSHRFGNLWLAGGASNSGGGVLRQFFTDAALAGLSMKIHPDQPSGLDYYPLPCPGERFPIHAPALLPRLAPRPTDDVRFLHGLLEGMARIEAQGYARLAELGATPLRRVISAGGGSKNEAWRRIRENQLGVPVATAQQGEAAFGAARLAQAGVKLFP
ncbi:sugar kinase [Sulfuriferula plumbiphila]|uniref:D-ribulose kinase n=1 Tax=Sulfuriferula plumbiphila TaxID=171865 RepID=A0A512L948_9PROT|nr:FGGY-family carbohydrate kinase [Sulfuriferula plumbiphila]BBP04390.1 sugar kinase [Sulfuriferula plumbiphila]GEP30993.1 sugar kinase [Sulfuriferula plumbiphila]